MPLIPKISETFKLLLALISVGIFDAVLKNDISDMFVPFNEVILLELYCMVDSTNTEELFCKLKCKI